MSLAENAQHNLSEIQLANDSDWSSLPRGSENGSSGKIMNLGIISHFRDSLDWDMAKSQEDGREMLDKPLAGIAMLGAFFLLVTLLLSVAVFIFYRKRNTVFVFEKSVHRGLDSHTDRSVVIGQTAAARQLASQYIDRSGLNSSGDSSADDDSEDDIVTGTMDLDDDLPKVPKAAYVIGPTAEHFKNPRFTQSDGTQLASPSANNSADSGNTTFKPDTTYRVVKNEEGVHQKIMHTCHRHSESSTASVRSHGLTIRWRLPRRNRRFHSVREIAYSLPIIRNTDAHSKPSTPTELSSPLGNPQSLELRKTKSGAEDETKPAIPPDATKNDGHSIP